jgi:hypothetical protein
VTRRNESTHFVSIRIINEQGQNSSQDDNVGVKLDGNHFIEYYNTQVDDGGVVYKDDASMTIITQVMQRQINDDANTNSHPNRSTLVARVLR